jgi:hypothetical protein
MSVHREKAESDCALPVAALSAKWASWGFYALLAGVVLALYVPSLRFGLIWDDPLWYQQGAGQTVWQTFTSLPTYQFYRPLTILLNGQLVSSNGVINAVLAHALQMAIHLGAAILAVPALQALGFDTWHARFSALVFAIHPFSYQAIAWQAPQQPIAMFCVLLAVLAADRFSKDRKPALLVCSLIAYAGGLFLQESALPFVFLFFWLALRDGKDFPSIKRRAWPLLHLALAVAYGLMWLCVPRRGHVISHAFEPIVLAYLLQGVAFPLARGVAGWPFTSSVPVLILLFSATWLLLALGLWRNRTNKPAILSSLWIIAGLVPVCLGLSWEYVYIGSRLLYPATLGIGGLWGGWMAWLCRQDKDSLARSVGAILTVLVVSVSLQQWASFQRLYQIGTQHLSRAIDIASAKPDARYLFINFPDRIEVCPKPYPLGYWGLTLAPVVQDLSDYAVTANGQSAETRSLSAFLTGAAARDAWPYRVDMRGENTSPEGLFKAASWADAVYLTHYVGDGSLGLEDVGTVRRGNASLLPMATFGERVHLVRCGATISSNAAQSLHLETVWSAFGPITEGDTIFAHLLTSDGVYVSSNDGDTLGGLLPMSSWQLYQLVCDQRDVRLPELPPGEYALTVGLYNRDSGERYEAIKPDGTLAHNGEYQVYTLVIPNGGERP